MTVPNKYRTDMVTFQKKSTKLEGGTGWTVYNTNSYGLNTISPPAPQEMYGHNS